MSNVIPTILQVTEDITIVHATVSDLVKDAISIHEQLFPTILDSEPYQVALFIDERNQVVTLELNTK